MEKLKKFLEDVSGPEFVQAILSGRRNKNDKTEKLKIRPVLVKDTMVYQCSYQVEKKQLHKNLTQEEMIKEVLDQMQERFRQMQVDLRSEQVSVLVSKKGVSNIKRKKIERILKADLSHNRKKRYLIPEGTVVPFMEDLGVMTHDGKIVQQKYDKFRQINRFLEFIEDIVPELEKEKERTIRILDFGCGKSYLTFALYYYLTEVRHLNVSAVGLDLKADVIENCNTLAKKYGYSGLQFFAGDISEYSGKDDIDMVVTLHACDTATDYALEKAVHWNTKVILSVPCCQHEINRQIDSEILKPVLKYGLIRERMSALITDAVRANLLEEAGYQVQILEFIDMEHTPKNILIRAVKKDSSKKNDAVSDKLNQCMDFLSIDPTLKNLLYPK